MPQARPQFWDTRPMPASRLRQLIALSALWLFVAGLAWIRVVQIFIVALAPLGTWQRPAIYRVTIASVERDADSLFTDHVMAMHNGKERYLQLLKTEGKQLQVDEEVWILDNYYAIASRPPQYRLTPQRLLVEYPEPLLLLALFGIRRLQQRHRREVKQALEDPTRKRMVLKDDFHLRAQRFAAPKEKDEGEA